MIEPSDDLPLRALRALVPPAVPVPCAAAHRLAWWLAEQADALGKTWWHRIDELDAAAGGHDGVCRILAGQLRPDDDGIALFGVLTSGAVARADWALPAVGDWCDRPLPREAAHG